MGFCSFSRNSPEAEIFAGYLYICTIQVNPSAVMCSVLTKIFWIPTYELL